MTGVQTCALPISAAVGKPLGADLREGKMTLPLIHLVANGSERGDAIVRDIMANRNASPEQWSELLGLLKESRSIEYSERRAVEFAERAKKALALFAPSAERDALVALPDYVLQRDR